MPKRVLVADDDERFRDLLRQLLIISGGDWQICAEAADGVEAIEAAKSSSPDLALVDISMPRLNGLEAGRQIIHHCQNTAVIALSMYDPQAVVEPIIKAGFRGFVLKNCVGSELIRAIETVLGGGTYFRLSAAENA